MQWDTSLNKDFDDCVALLVAVGYGLKEGDLGYSTRFSRHTLREQTSAYKRVISSARDGERSSHFLDIRKCILALTGIRDARGISVQGLGSRAGHRAAAANGQVQRGGKRVKEKAFPGETMGGQNHLACPPTRISTLACPPIRNPIPRHSQSAKRRSQQKTRGSTLTWRRRDCD